jgi:hypothetical protein
METQTAIRWSKSPACKEADKLIRREMEQHKCSRSEAASRVFKANPSLRQRMLDEANR